MVVEDAWCLRARCTSRAQCRTVLFAAGRRERTCECAFGFRGSYALSCVSSRDQSQCTRTHARSTYIHAHAHARTHACTHARTHAHTHAHTHTRTHIRTQVLERSAQGPAYKYTSGVAVGDCLSAPAEALTVLSVSDSICFLKRHKSVFVSCPLCFLCSCCLHGNSLSTDEVYIK
jgi:hypothetical protein